MDIDHNALREHPALATLIAYAITDWARVEANLGTALIVMLGAEAQAAAAMYGALKSPQAKAETFSAVARMILSKELAQVFEAVLAHVNRVAEMRNRLAHGLWATSKEVPGALLVVDAKNELVRQRGKAELAWNNLDEMPSDEQIPKLHPKDVFVYREEDLKEVIEDIQKCYLYTNSLISLAGINAVGRESSEAERIKVGLSASHARIYSQLSSEPPIQKFLQRQAQQTMKAQAGVP